jgi:hypothetical protein
MPSIVAPGRKHVGLEEQHAMGLLRVEDDLIPGTLPTRACEKHAHLGFATSPPDFALGRSC